MARLVATAAAAVSVYAHCPRKTAHSEMFPKKLATTANAPTLQPATRTAEATTQEQTGMVKTQEKRTNLDQLHCFLLDAARLAEPACPQNQVGLTSSVVPSSVGHARNRKTEQYDGQTVIRVVQPQGSHVQRNTIRDRTASNSIEAHKDTEPSYHSADRPGTRRKRVAGRKAPVERCNDVTM